MSRWRFWEKSDEISRAPAPASPEARFSARPRADIASRAIQTDPAKSEKLVRLERRREAVMFDVEQAELATARENPWRDRAGLLDQAIAQLDSERERIDRERAPVGQSLDPTPIDEIVAELGPPPTVSFRIGSERFRYEEEIDWAERGSQIARSELERQAGDPAVVVTRSFDEAERDRLASHLTASLFSFASDLRDRLLAGEPLPSALTLTDLAQPDDRNGGWLSWGGHSPNGAAKHQRLRELDTEGQRLLAERARVLDEMARIADRLPIALRRLAEVDAEIEAARR